MKLIQIAAVDLLIRTARSTNGAGEHPVGSNAGPYVERVLKRVGLTKGNPWCCAQISDWGMTAFPKDHPLTPFWPMVSTGGCQFFYEWCVEVERKKKIQIIFDTPERGDIGLIWHPEMKPAARFAHILLVTELPNLTIGGNTTWPKDKNSNDPRLAREGWCVAEKPWTFKPKDRFIRWINLLP